MATVLQQKAQAAGPVSGTGFPVTRLEARPHAAGLAPLPGSGAGLPVVSGVVSQGPASLVRAARPVDSDPGAGPGRQGGKEQKQQILELLTALRVDNHQRMDAAQAEVQALATHTAQSVQEVRDELRQLLQQSRDDTQVLRGRVEDLEEQLEDERFDRQQLARQLAQVQPNFDRLAEQGAGDQRRLALALVGVEHRVGRRLRLALVGGLLLAAAAVFLSLAGSQGARSVRQLILGQDPAPSASAPLYLGQLPNETAGQ